ncbi:hypothetical protein Tsubulata_024755 [Turnera subulata]|uniref:NAB domain-containing protein n=1 Tax=Turnera subulata TaxID=218843 RepID=A0A9Q0FK16_9ROSI|nr:hypothetical protein Tsubulata_024755 [Turnera subulata]
MAATTPAASKRKYSWWWDSHISPKNSKWLQENLTDMDVKVKQMIKLIEEDADSFARRAEMYYKKRPELMKLVEEFYRAYRALAERYDHATGALRQAHRTMAEAFPNQIPFMLSDDSPGFLTDGDPRALFDSDEQQKDVSGISPFHAHSTRRNGAFTDESDSVLGRKGLKQFNDLFGSGDGLHHGKFAEGRARKGLNFNEAEEKDRGLQNSGIHETRARVPSDSERMSKAELEILNLKNALAKLEAEKDASLLQYQQNLERLSNLESEVSRAKEDSKGFSERASRAEAEVQSLKDALAKLDSEREASLKAVFEGKTHELIQVCEKLEVGNYSKSMEIDQLKSTVSFLEGGNAELKAQMTAYLPAFISLRNSIASLENHVLSDAARHGADMEAKDAATLVDAERCQQISEEQSAMQSGGFAELKELQKRIRAIEEAAMEKERLIMLENLTANSKLESALKLIDELKSGSSLRTEGLESGKHVNQKQEGRELGAAPGNDLRLPKRTHEISEEGGEVMTKDIMLDQISECSSYGISRRETLEADNQMLEIWETTGRNGSIDLTVGKTLKATATGTEKKHKGPYPSTESLVEKEVGVDRLEISKRLSGSFQEGNGKKILERLDSDAQKLTNLQITVQDLKKKVEFTEKSTKGKGFEYDSVKEQLEESEEAILKLLDVNHRLMKCMEDESVSSSVKSALTPDENMGIQRRKISEQARRVSEKIGRLQLEVQKLQFLLLKLDDENKSRGKTKITERNTRVLLRDYLYGKTRPSQKRKKKHFCSCMQPPTD